MKLEDFSHLITHWNALAQQAAPHAFKEGALDALRQHLPFDAAWWGTGVRGARHPRIIESHPYRLPQRFALDWLAVSADDSFAFAVQAQVGVTQALVDDSGYSEAMRAFDRHYDLGPSLATSHGDAQTGFGTFLSVFRRQDGAPFSEDERVRMQLLVPHLMHAGELSWRHALGAYLENQLVADVDDDACLVGASGAFCQQLLREWPAWQGGPLPLPLARAIAEGQRHWSGKQVHIELADGGPQRVRLTLRPRVGDGLTASQERVAREYVAGFSYKEIARNLGLAPSTVRTYLRECYLKLGVSNKLELSERVGPASRPKTGVRS
ncbi:helix-turn-helix transcriptional regulator [Duganella sp. LX20W]|uniref:Helix-turn-helix transcriptional regulator n=1 Tax=Rugamonas brunnea TaxID=2758569 RepID=A0A7W2EV78_9BURK|nr:helix-turn-helix transcriptional regulator [Rugamonas brunnea]MBA5639196.1 helix-turn-helix transcriptional regulator [Rugamonas brunnea]